MFSMPKSGLPKGIRKFIRRQKALIRKRFLDMAEQEERIKEIYSRLGITHAKLNTRKRGISQD